MNTLIDLITANVIKQNEGVSKTAEGPNYNYQGPRTSIALPQDPSNNVIPNFVNAQYQNMQYPCRNQNNKGYGPIDYNQNGNYAQNFPNQQVANSPRYQNEDPYYCNPYTNWEQSPQHRNSEYNYNPQPE